MIAGYLDEAVETGAIPPIDAALTGVAWFGAVNEVVARWLLADDPAARDGLSNAPRAAVPQRPRGREHIARHSALSGRDRRRPAFDDRGSGSHRFQVTPTAASASEPG